MYGMLPGHDGEQADADMAYCQTTFRGTTTCVRLPRHRWPKHWGWVGYYDPACPLELALYGHPESGYYWEEDCDQKLKQEGFIPIEEWPGSYWHPKHRAMVIVYVDDFKVSAPVSLPGIKNNLKALWGLICKHVEMSDPEPPGMFLGCMYRRFDVPCVDAPGGYYSRYGV